MVNGCRSLHDVGYIRLPRNILRRKTRLIGEEQHLFKRHPEFGLKLLESCPAISDESRRIVIEHHESQNGKGYPKGLCGEAVSNLSYLVGSVDRFDGLVSGWGQQTPIPSALALRGLYKEVREGGLSLTAVESLIKCLGVYPIGTVVGLSTGEQAIVLKGNPQEPMKPLIKLLTDSMGQSQGTMPLIDLASPDPHSSDRSIASILDPTACQVDVVRHLQ